jgi:hypothetical protein
MHCSESRTCNHVGMQSTANRPPAALAGRSADALAGLFARAGAPDPPPDGRYAGALLALTLAPGADALGLAVFEATAPWLGKRFDAAAGSGENVLRRSVFGVGRALTPRRYRAWWPEDEQAFRALPFRTSRGPSALDPDVSVLRIDYDVEQNHPRLRRILDELVQVEPGVYLGQALWRRAGVHRLAWFSLERTA